MRTTDIVRRTTTATVGVAAAATLAATTLLAHLALAGQPNPGLAALAALPAGAAAALWARRRWAPALLLLVAPLMVGVRVVDLSFDLVRPHDPVPFAVAAAHVLAAAIAAVAAAQLLLARDRAVPGLLAGVALAAATAAGLLVLSPQGDSAVTAERVLTVEMANYRFQPSQLRLDGGPVALRFRNDTDDSHSFTIDALGVDVEVPSGRSRVLVVHAGPGEYAVHCTVGDHRESGMVGRLVVPGGHHHG